MTNAEECDAFLRDLSQALESYALSLNIRKTKVISLPAPSREPWVTEINTLVSEQRDRIMQGTENLSIQRIRTVIDRAITLSNHYPDSSVVKYALSALIERCQPTNGLMVIDDPAVRYLEDSILRHAYHTPNIIPIIQRWLQHYPSLDQRVEERVVTRLEILLNRAIELGQSDNVVWCLYYLLQVGDSGHEVDLKKCLLNEEPMVVAMGYCFSKVKKLETDIFKKWAGQFQNKIESGAILHYDVDKYWLPLYLMFFDGLIDNMPYVADSDRQPFVLMKQLGVTFVDADHADFGGRVQSRFRAMFGDVDAN